MEDSPNVSIQESKLLSFRKYETAPVVYCLDKNPTVNAEFNVHPLKVTLIL